MYLQTLGLRNVEWWDAVGKKWKSTKDVPAWFKLDWNALDFGDKPAEPPRAASVDKVVLGQIY